MLHCTVSIDLYLLCWQTTLQDNVTHPALSNHHSLGTSKATECCVGGQVSLANYTHALDVWDVVGVIHMEQSSVHNLMNNRYKTEGGNHLLT